MCLSNTAHIITVQFPLYIHYRLPSYDCYQEFPSDMRPQRGDVLAFKTLTLDEETWTPELSSYREAEVRVCV